MPKLLITLLLTGSTLINGYAQEWIDLQYSYDSIMNIPYGSEVNFNGETETLLMDLYLPKCQVDQVELRRPLAIFIHGGAFISGSKDEASIQQYCKNFAKRGYVTAAISYRLGFISDDQAWTCNFPNYNCVFASDTSEWIRAYYRGVQDAKGALRYLMNQNQQYMIDTSNVFISGESAGSFIAMGAALMDVDSERPIDTYALSNAPAPNTNTMTCSHNSGQVFTGPISRPDLGGIQGSIEPSTVNYTIKGIGNIFGAMFGNLLQENDPLKLKPAIYSFHQPCDLIVPINSKQALWGLDWCMTNGYGCFAIANTPIAHGSQTISDWNTNNSYGYSIENHFTAQTFPYNFAFGPASCLDQGNTPCHAYDNRTARESELALFFSNLVTTGAICETVSLNENAYQFEVYPNPSGDILTIRASTELIDHIYFRNIFGDQLNLNAEEIGNGKYSFNISSIPKGSYIVEITLLNGDKTLVKFIHD